MMKKGPLFYAKILLFGEYGIIKDSKGLAIPFNHYEGGLQIGNLADEKVADSNQKIKKFAVYLNEKQAEFPDLLNLNFKQFNKDLSEGLFFKSNIPEGYGVGSSGALVASIYERYATEKITVLENLTGEKLLKLKEIFGLMESFFHGKSSGLDPLNSYLSLPILIQSPQEIEATGIPSQKQGKGAVFLIDSEQVGETGDMVEIFMEKMKNEGFRKTLKTEFIKYTDACVHDFLKGDIKSLFGNLKQLSSTAYRNFTPMIPVHMRNVWKKGIETDDYYLKLCGSGGGGYILGFAEDFDKVKEQLKDYKLQVVYRF
jgi:mevalonate kinase